MYKKILTFTGQFFFVGVCSLYKSTVLMAYSTSCTTLYNKSTVTYLLVYIVINNSLFNSKDAISTIIYLNYLYKLFIRCDDYFSLLKSRIVY